MTEASLGVRLQMCPWEGLLQLLAWMLGYSLAGVAGVSVSADFTGCALFFRNVLTKMETHTFCSGFPRPKLQAEGGKKPPEASEFRKQILEKLQGGRGGSLSLRISHETRQPEV